MECILIFVPATPCKKDHHKRPIGVQNETHQNMFLNLALYVLLNAKLKSFTIGCIAWKCVSQKKPRVESFKSKNHPSGFFSGKSKAGLCTKFISWELLLIHENSGTEVDARWGNHLHSESSFTILSWNLHEQPIIQHFPICRQKITTSCGRSVQGGKCWTK